MTLAEYGETNMDLALWGLEAKTTDHTWQAGASGFGQRSATCPST